MTTYPEEFEDLDPELYCLKHGKELPMSEYGVRYSGCEDCEPERDDDGECFRGGEAAAYQAEQQAWIQRNLK